MFFSCIVCLYTLLISIVCLYAGALNSREDWSNPSRNWRKREAYIALMRHVNNCKNYHQWDCFRFVDFTDRAAWAKTFNVRHLPLSNGDPANFSGRLANPERWNNPQAPPPRKRSKNTDESDDGSESPNMFYDYETLSFVNA